MIKTKLFRAQSYIDCGPGMLWCHWFICNRLKGSLPYSQLIENYENLSSAKAYLLEEYIDELFLPAELNALQVHIRDISDMEVQSSEVALPLTVDEQNVIPFAAAHVGDGPELSMFFMHENYNLPFNVMVYFDTRSVDLH